MEFGGPPWAATIPYMREDPGAYAIGVPLGKPTLTDGVGTALRSLVRDGTYGQILRSWNLAKFAMTVDDMIFAYGTPERLTVVKRGTGSGTVTGDSGGWGSSDQIDCGTTCWIFVQFLNDANLDAVPAEGSRFAGWSGGGCTDARDCYVTIDTDTTVTATFTKLPAPGSSSK